MTATPSPASPCGRCGTQATAVTEGALPAAVGSHADAHAVWDQLDAVQRDGLASILRTVLPARELAEEILALADRHGAGSR